MLKYKYRKGSAVLLAGTLVFSAATPAFAKTQIAGKAEKNAEESVEAEVAEKNTEESTEAVEEAAPMTLEEIQKEALKNNRLQSTLELNYKKVLAGLDAIDDGLSDLRDAQDSAAHARRDASAAAAQGENEINRAVAADAQSENPLGYTEQTLAGISGALLSGSAKIASGIEDMTDSIAKTQRDTLEEQQQDLKNTKQDLNKTQEDWKNQALLVSQLLVVKTVQIEKGIGLLEEKQALMERLYSIEEKKAALGFSIAVDLKEAKLSVEANAKEIEAAKNGLILVKRQINDLMGRAVDEALEVEAPKLTRVIEYAPEYTEELLKEATEKNYQLKTLRRAYQQAEKKSNDSSLYSGQIKAHESDMDIATVSMESQEVAIANDLKKKLDSINQAAKAYQLQKDTKEKAAIQWEQQQQSAKLGLVSGVELQALELQYAQNELALMQAAYDYDLAWEEYRLLINGTSLDIYDSYKEQVAG